jgi:hypothetical protein
MLHRLGADATLTLGNKKSVDIVVVLARRTIRRDEAKYTWAAWKQLL